MQEVEGLRNRLGDGPQFLQAIVDEKYLTKDEACRQWADTLNVAYVDPFASIITEEATEKIPVEVAKKAKSLGLYVLDGVMTVAMARTTPSTVTKAAAMPIQSLATSFTGLSCHYVTCPRPASC